MRKPLQKMPALAHCGLIRRELERSIADYIAKLRGAETSIRVSRLRMALESMDIIESELRGLSNEKAN